ncbi:MAG: glutathione S-transferase family protein [Aromatoleum sp.]|jgi:glutathione S-transferase|uniref:glutathione S-transferase family protein n=1 Tax=Aromatoleum sp. TaxID=2307007 RepID=UPI0028956654|nr:glutathione S-transferase family protein [Aromatoleum sp.]MDT3671024.1 glutathione S-transferase family protein [Aromatoleum sp.]
MKLYHSIGPNPRFVRMFAAEKGLTPELVEVDIVAGDNRRAPFLQINPTGTTPVLVLDDGTTIAETTAICEYLEELVPQPALIGASARERAIARMWWRRGDLMVVQPMTAGFRAAEGLSMFQDRVRCLPQAAEDLKRTAQEGLAWFDAQLGERPYVAGDALSVADLLLYCFVEFGELVGQGLDPSQRRLAAWRDRVGSRPSASVR